MLHDYLSFYFQRLKHRNTCVPHKRSDEDIHFSILNITLVHFKHSFHKRQRSDVVCTKQKVTNKGIIEAPLRSFLFALDQSGVKYISTVQSKISEQFPWVVSMSGAQVHLLPTLHRRLPVGNSHCIKMKFSIKVTVQ